jgi:hypothetical protein
MIIVCVDSTIESMIHSLVPFLVSAYHLSVVASQGSILLVGAAVMASIICYSERDWRKEFVFGISKGASGIIHSRQVASHRKCSCHFTSRRRAVRTVVEENVERNRLSFCGARLVMWRPPPHSCRMYVTKYPCPASSLLDTKLSTHPE